MSSLISVSLISPRIVRVRIGEPRYPSLAVIKSSNGGSGGPIVSIDENAVHVRFNEKEFNAYYSVSGDEAIIRGELGPFDRVYGLGEKALPLNRKRYRVTMWNTDAYGYRMGSDPLYVSIPFFIILRNGEAIGHFIDSPARMVMDMGQENLNEFKISIQDSAVDHYIIYGPSIKDVINEYHELTGKPFLPPKWALGNQQSRYSYYPDSTLLAVVEQYKSRGLPLSAIYLDIHYMDGYKIFTWSKERFPDPSGLVARLHEAGIKVVTIIDPGVKASPTYDVFRSGVMGNYFCLRSNGDLYTSHVWPGLCVFPDFARSDVRDWWSSLIAEFVKDGIDGIWLDMNEPAGFDSENHTIDGDLMHVMNGAEVPHYRLHNAYALLEAEATYEGLLRARPDKRPFILSRAGYAGIHRYAAIWTGDNTSNWEHLRLQIPMLLSLSLSGVPMVGADVGGFAKNTKQGHFEPDAELLVRWYESAIFFPFLRNHTSIDSPDQEPWAWGSAYEEVIKKLLMIRESLMPYIYSLAWASHELGEPIIRPLVYEFQDDDNTHSIDDEFMLGPFLLLTPALDKGIKERYAYLPRGRWLDLRRGREVDGGKIASIDVPMGDPPMLIRSGGIVPTLNGELRVLIYPGQSSAFTIYDDDGESLQARPRKLFVRQVFDGSKITINIDGEEWSGQAILWIYTGKEPRQVLINGSPTEHLSKDKFTEVRAGPGSNVELII